MPPLALRSHTIEQTPEYCNISAEAIGQQCMHRRGALTMPCAVRGRAGAGGARSLLFRGDFMNMKAQLDAVLQAEPTFDLVFVDGRSRLACALYMLAHLTDDSVVLVHDFFSRVKSPEALERYGHLDKLFDYYTMIGRTRSLAAFKLRRDLPKDPAAYQDAWVPYGSLEF